MTIQSRRRASWFLLAFTAILAAGLGALLTQAQLTAARHAEHARLIEARSAAILDTAPVALIMTDTHGTITYFNPQAEHLLGWTSEEIVGQPAHRLVSQRSAEKHESRFKQAIEYIRKHEGAWQFTRQVEGHAVTKTGEELHVHIVVRGIKYNGFVEFAAVLYPAECSENGKIEIRPFAPVGTGRTLPRAFEQVSQH